MGQYEEALRELLINVLRRLVQAYPVILVGVPVVR
jgi:hypothetical protein